MRSRSLQAAVLFGSLLALAGLAFAQSARPHLHGTITDAKGAVVSGRDRDAQQYGDRVRAT